MFELLIALLAAILPACPTGAEDDPWCVADNVVNLAPADPAPISFEIPR